MTAAAKDFENCDGVGRRLGRTWRAGALLAAISAVVLVIGAAPAVARPPTLRRSGSNSDSGDIGPCRTLLRHWLSGEERDAQRQEGQQLLPGGQQDRVGLRAAGRGPVRRAQVHRRRGCAILFMAPWAVPGPRPCSSSIQTPPSRYEALCAAKI